MPRRLKPDAKPFVTRKRRKTVGQKQRSIEAHRGKNNDKE